MGSWRCRCGQDNWEGKTHCRSCGITRFKGSAKRVPSQGKRDHGQWKAGKGAEKGGGKGQAKGSGFSPQGQLPAILPAKPSDARKHSAYLPVPQNLQEKQLHISTIKSKLDGLHKLREVSQLAGRTGSDVDTSEIAVLRHMLFAAENPEEIQASKTWSRVLELRNQFTAAIQKEREARAKVREIQNVMDHFNEIYEELREEQQARERSPTPDMGRREGEIGGGSPGMEGVSAAPTQQAGSQQWPQPSYSVSPSSQQQYGFQSIGAASPTPYPGGDGQWGQQGWHSGWNQGDTMSQQDGGYLQAQVQQLAHAVGTMMERLGAVSAPAQGHPMDGRAPVHPDGDLDLTGEETQPPPPTGLYGDDDTVDRGKSRSRSRAEEASPESPTRAGAPN